MKCPVCLDNELIRQNFLADEKIALVVNSCSVCEGTWFFKGELDSLDDSVWTDVEHLDFIHVESHQKAMLCPHCELDLVALTPKENPDIHLEQCPVCKGFWLEKGELDALRELAMKIDSDLSHEYHLQRKPPDWSALKYLVMGNLILGKD